MPKKKNWPPEDGDITHLIERLDALEERNNVRFEALRALFFIAGDGPHYVRVCGEIHARDGLEIGQQLKVAVTVYDPTGRVMNTSSCYVAAPEKFYGFEAFSTDINAFGSPIAKIRIYPQRV